MVGERALQRCGVGRQRPGTLKLCEWIVDHEGSEFITVIPGVSYLTYHH